MNNLKDTMAEDRKLPPPLWGFPSQKDSILALLQGMLPNYHIEDNCAADKVKFDPVTKPSHYNHNRLGVECIKAIEASMSPEEYLGYLKGTVIKYLWRYRYKDNPVQDLDKAKTYLGWLAEAYAKQK